MLIETNKEMNFVNICEPKTEENDYTSGDSNLENDPFIKVEQKKKRNHKNRKRRRSKQPRPGRRIRMKLKHTIFERELILKDFLCPFCEKVMMSTNSLNSHIKDLHSGKKLECAICDVNFEKICEMTEHIYCVHEVIRPYECSGCSASYYEK